MSEDQQTYQGQPKPNTSDATFSKADSKYVDPAATAQTHVSVRVDTTETLTQEEEIDSDGEKSGKGWYSDSDEDPYTDAVGRQGTFAKGQFTKLKAQDMNWSSDEEAEGSGEEDVEDDDDDDRFYDANEQQEDEDTIDKDTLNVVAQTETTKTTETVSFRRQ
ncbi:hypothetical protein M231_05174 [Tremella mesenterica]|uniref:Uncharacterized protein n=1 Tax=Tremella mesenterica TaxID=5217 RepID=A0A4Q1BIP1_TREME|nr:hypothetical protein M231_05174 [Tremella mesenterica]